MKLNFFKSLKKENFVDDQSQYEETDMIPAGSDQDQGQIEWSDSTEIDSYGGPGDAGDSSTLRDVMNLYARCCEVKEKTAQVQAWSQVKITETVAKYKSCQEFLYFTFGERDKALSKHYDLLDKAVESGDKDLIVAALSGISNIVTSSPLSDFDKFVKLYEDTSQPLLDF